MNNTILAQWMDAHDYRITEGWQYQWQCYGANAQGMDSQHGTVIFDRATQTVYEMTVDDPASQRVYRWINPNVVQAHHDEARSRSVDLTTAYDQVRYTDLETVSDYMTKAAAIVRGQPYDDRIEVELNLPDHEMLQLMTLAHQRDITFNQLVEEALQQAIDEYNRDPEGARQRAQRWKDEKGIL